MPLSPVPFAPEVITSQGWLEIAIHGQVMPFVVIVTEPLPPADGKLAVAGESAVTMHGAGS